MPALWVSAIGAIGGALAGGSGGSQQTGNQTITNQTAIDPRIGNILYGTGKTLKPGVTPTYGPSTPDSQVWVPDGSDAGGHMQTIPGAHGQATNPDSDYTTDSGVIGKITDLIGTPQAAGLSQLGNQVNGALGASGLQNYADTMAAVRGLQSSNYAAPTMSGAQSGFNGMQAVQGSVPGSMNAASVNAPGQNNLGLTSAFNDMIYGNPGSNPYLTGAIQKGINQSQNAFTNLQTDATNNLLRNVLPSIRSGAVINGTLGGSRQGIAEGNALGQFGTEMARAAGQYGQNNTDAAVSAQAGAYDTDRNRALNAAGNLNSNQYGTATNNAQFQQAANSTNYSGNLAMAQSNLGFANNAAQNNAAWANQNNQFNANSQNNASQNNANWQQNNNQLNSTNQLNGINSSNNTMNNLLTIGQNQDQYATNKIGKISSLLSPFTGLGGSSTQSQPIYSNPMGNAIGGAVTGLGLANAYNKSNNGMNGNGAGYNPRAYDYSENMQMYGV